MNFTLNYRFDWRAKVWQFRNGNGAAALAEEAVSLWLRQLVWVSLWGCVAVVALHFRLWIVAVPCTFGTLIFALYSSRLRNLGRKAAIGLRNDWRSAGSRAIRLEVSDEGLRESDAGVVSFAPWSAVKNYRLHRNLLCLELDNGQAALIPIAIVAEGKFQVQTLINELTARGIPAKEVGPRG